MILDDDPILGAAIANYPSNRARLLLVGGAILGAVWLVVTLLLLPIDATVAATITITVLAITTLGVGWWMSHLWNREVVLYQHGFSYREGSFTAYLRYEDVRTIRQRMERVAYFGGIIRRTIYRCTIQTVQDEIITLTNVYRKMDDLSIRLEQRIQQAQFPLMVRRLEQGEHVPFTDALTVSSQGLHSEGRELSWADFGGHRIQNKQLLLLTQSGDTWLALSPNDVDNIALLLALLGQKAKMVKSGV